MDPEELLYGVAIPELAMIAFVDRSTASRWKRGLARVPRAVLELVRLRVFGELAGVWGRAWSGWRIGRDGLLYAPAWRRGFDPGEILGLPFLHGRVAALERELADAVRRRRLDFHHAGRRCSRRRRRA